MSDNPPDWALDEAVRRLDVEHCLRFPDSAGVYANSPRPHDSPQVRVIARLIAAHEEPPVDPLLIEARKVAAYTEDDGDDYFDEFDRDILKGEHDSDFSVRVALAALRRGIEIERERSK